MELYKQKTWERRWEVLKTTIEKMESRLQREGIDQQIEALAEPFGEAKETVTAYLRQNIEDSSELLKILKPVSERLFQYFCEQFYPSDQSIPETKYSANYVFKTFLEQISIDLSNLQQLYDQRFGDEANPDEIDPYILTLAMADSVARMSIQPAIRAGLLGNGDRTTGAPNQENVAILSFLNERVKIRILPYYDATLMGVPFSAFAEFREQEDKLFMTISSEFLAIPHETGHLIFRNGRVHGEGPTIETMLAEQLFIKLYQQSSEFESSMWIFQWLEEIFADAYGCLIAGPGSTLGFTQVLATGLPIDPHQELGKHPIPALRVLIQLNILRQLYPNLPEIKKQEDRWREWVQVSWGIADIEEAIYKVRGQERSGHQILADLRPLIDVVIGELQKWIVEENSHLKAIKWTNWTNNGDGTVSSKIDSNFMLKDIERAEKAVRGNEQRKQPPRPSQKLTGRNGPLRNLEELLRTEPLDTVIEHILFRGWSDEGGEGTIAH